MAREILRVGAVAGVSTVQTNVTVALTTALVGLAAGPAAIAGFGTAARLEYLLVPLVFGLGAPLVALVSESLAQRRFPDGDAIGKRLRVGPTDGPAHTIVGVVGG